MNRIREAFVFRGGGAGIDTDKAKRWGITRLWYEADDPVASPLSLAACLMRGVDVGLMRDPYWDRDPIHDPGVMATRMSGDLTNHGFGAQTNPYHCGAMFDNENQSALEILEMLRAFRALRPYRLLRWTLAPWQAGWIGASAALINFINNDANLVLVVQNYLGEPRMFPCAGDQVIAQLVNIGIQRARLTLFLDGEQAIPYGWAGVIYNFLALPAAPPMPL